MNRGEKAGHLLNIPLKNGQNNVRIDSFWSFWIAAYRSI